MDLDETVALTSPFNSRTDTTLPVELLILVFSFCIVEDPDFSSVISLVCRQWRSIMVDIPSLWPRLHLCDTKFNAGHLRDKSDLWFTRRAALPLDIDFDTRRRDSVLPMVSHTLSGVNRWRNVSYLQSHMRFLTTSDHVAPRLETLFVTLAPNKAIPSDQEAELSPLSSDPAPWSGSRDLIQTKNFQGAGRERLRELYVLGVRCLPSPDQVTPFMTVTSLVLMNCKFEFDFPMHRVVPFLSTFPALEALELANYNDNFLQNDPEYRPDCPALAPAMLPHLRRLTVRAICSSRCIFSHIAAPNLEVLSIMSINSSRIFDFPLTEEEGESEDEDGATDFSQSPWTDRETGMGLRKLFARGAPPLRELILDYADLRAKDFHWLLPLLTHLEHLQLIASDLSDRVLRVFEISDSSMPLPRLARLELMRCRALTGDAVVRMVKSRVRAAEEGRVASFAEFRVTECRQVNAQHVELLQSVFPAEGRLSFTPASEEVEQEQDEL